MKKLLFSFLSILIGCTLNAQSISAKIIDNETSEPLPFVNIGIKDSKLGTVSDYNGDFELNTGSTKSILVLSYIGYETLELIASDLEMNESIAMQAIPFMIDEVEITNTNFDKELILGVRNENGRGKSIGFGNAQLGTELGALIEIKKESYIKSVNFVLNHAKGDSLLLRVNIYNYENGEIGEKMLKHNVYIKDLQRKGRFTIDLEEYELILHNNVLLSLEWLRDFDENGNKLITFDTKKSRKLAGTFIRTNKTQDFIRLPYKKKLKPCIYFVAKQSSN